jgi:hypothetical protein
VVEDGTGKSDADAYVATADVLAYAQANGLLWDPSTDDAANAAVRAATRYVDGAYRVRWPGWRLNQRQQALEWPRSNAVTDNGYEIDANEVPRELRAAVCELAVREAAGPGSLSPDTSSATVVSVKADTVSVDFGPGGYTGGAPVFTSVAMLLAPILRCADPFSGKSGRG